MKKKLGFWSIVLLAVNAIIGSGIFLSPGSVVTLAGTKTAWVYLTAALFAAVLAITFAAAAKYVTKSGAAYAYAKAAFGENVGFYVGITRFVAASIAWGVLATGVVKTVLSIFGLDSTDFWLVTYGFIGLMVVLLLIHLLGAKVFEFINNLSTIGKLFALVTTIVAGGYLLITTGQNHFADINDLKNASGQPLIAPMNTSVFVTATIAAFYAFTGFESVASGSEDMQEPQKNLPKAIPLAILIIAAIYIGIVLVAMTLDPKAIVETKEVVALVAIFDNVIIRNIVLYGALISMFGINVAASFLTPRVLEAMANEKQIPQWFAKRTSRDFPLRAFMITALIAIVIPMAFKYNMTSIIVLSSISRFVQYLVVPIGVICFFYGKNAEPILNNVSKNWLTDVGLPIISVGLTGFLLIKFDWVGQFTILDAAGKAHANWYAICAMLIGYLILPAILFMMTKKEKKMGDF
ncbi:APC family permease [Ligilactobacillus sp. Marseille-Q7487]|uniref:APC family permease n=1 Tax=Ligilactobacillus sp. Marseille-Q7487 TaxID=3022128 RepID=UPI0024A7C38D|nr:APC family permease [Ligilactobacillus sp. Marseille-Q7487]